MRNILIDPTESSLKVNLNYDESFLLIEGESRPEDALKFFEPILLSLNYFKKSLNESRENLIFEVVFKLDYFNSTSTKFIVDIAKILKAIDEIPYAAINTKWYYKKIDEDIMESGYELADWTGLQIEMVEIEE